VCENRKFVELNFPHFPTFLSRDAAPKNRRSGSGGREERGVEGLRGGSGALGVPPDLNRKIGREEGGGRCDSALRGRDEDSGFD